jgi:hypothetical protein
MAAFIMSSYSYELSKSLPLGKEGLVRMEKFGRKRGAEYMP